MALVIEDGSGLSTANAYIDAAIADTHHDDRGNTRWTDFTLPEKEQAIVRATDYVDKRFGKRFRGGRKLKDQALEWPRLDAFDDDGFLLSGGLDDIPRNLQKAVAEYALRAAICNVLAPDPTLPVPKQDLTSGAAERDTAVITGEVTRKKEVVGPLEEETWYQTASKTASQNLGAGAKSIQSSLVNDFIIPEYPEADMWVEELLRPSMAIELARA